MLLSTFIFKYLEGLTIWTYNRKVISLIIKDKVSRMIFQEINITRHASGKTIEIYLIHVVRLKYT